MLTNNTLTIKRQTTESVITVTLSEAPVKENYRDAINTPIAFLNHMIEHIVWRSNLNIGVTVELDKFNLSHLVCEDVGMTVGKAVAQYLSNNHKQGINGFGDGTGIIDEARARAAISFEFRPLFLIDNKIDIPFQTEGVNSEDLTTFLDGFARGASCTLHLIIESGVNGHHIWESAFRALGTALGRALAKNPDRADMTSGVAGEIKYTVE